MIRILHCADLHLTGNGPDRDYSLSVLDEILLLAGRHSADYLLLCGDTFNTFGDAELLRAEFRGKMSELSGSCEVLLLAGNHEDLGRKGRKLAGFDLGIQPENVIEHAGTPFSLIRRDGIEFLALPHRAHYGDYTEWSVPEKRERYRVALAHGIVAGMAYTGEDEESDERAAVMDADIFQRYEVDYAALGHIHSARREKSGSVEILYPGSARVWRKNEAGPRKAALVELDEGIGITPLELKSAGQFRSLDVFIDFEGRPADLPPESREWGAADYAALRFSGLVENEGIALQSIKNLVENLEKRLRRIECDYNLSVLEGVSLHPMAKKFLELWESKKPSGTGDEYEVWMRAREMGLMKIKEVMEARS